MTDTFWVALAWGLYMIGILAVWMWMVGHEDD